MPGRNILELDANRDVDGNNAFESSFANMHIDELMLEFDPKHSGPPVAILGNTGGGTKEVHPAPLRGRDGRFSATVGGQEAWSSIRITMARGMKGKLMKVKLIGKPPA